MKKAGMTRNAALLLLSLTLAACGSQQSSVPAQTTAQTQAASTLQALATANIPGDETPQAWFVELSEQPTTKGGNSAAIGQQKKVFRDQASALGIRYQERRSFEKLWNGVSIQVNPADLGKIRDLDGVKAVFPVMKSSLPIEPLVNTPIEPDMATAITQTGVDVAHNELGLTGKGVRIGIIDTGIDLGHPAFAGRIVASYDFVGDAYNGSNAPVPGKDTVDDCAGHGTHVAGIAAAAGALPGVAPDAQLGVYRVFGCNGSANDDVILQAMERAQSDRMDVVNMSLGSAFQGWPEYPLAVAANNMVDQGIVMTISAGNEGAAGTTDGGVWGIGSPSLGDKVISVASFSNTTTVLPAFTVSPDGRKVGFNAATGAPIPPTSGSLPLAKTGTPTAADGCTALPANSLSGKAVLIRRGTCSFYIKAFNAQQAGAAAVVLYNNAAGYVSPTVAGDPPITIPVVAISAADGALLDGRIAAGTTTLTWSGETVSTPNPNANLIDTFSSYGLTAELTLKPDLGAPGGTIRSTYPRSLEPSGYASLSGTSMASPHVAGVAALVIEAKRKAGQPIRAEEMRGLLQNTARPELWSGNPNLGFLDYVHRQGAGMINVVKAVETKATVSPSKLSLGESQSGVPLQTLTVSNSGSTPITYTASHVGALSTTGSYAATIRTYGPGATASFSSPTVTVPAGGKASITVTITPGDAPDLGIYGGYVVLTPNDNSPTLRVPYAGFKGDYQALKIFTAAPQLIRNDGASGNMTFTMRGEDYPVILMHLDHFARWLKLDVLEASTMQPVNSQFFNAETDNYLPRNSKATSAFGFSWDGQVSWSRGKSDNALNKRKPVPNGQYVLRVTALKALGDENNPAHIETWVSPVITVNAPKK